MNRDDVRGDGHLAARLEQQRAGLHRPQPRPVLGAYLEPGYVRQALAGISSPSHAAALDAAASSQEGGPR